MPRRRLAPPLWRARFIVLSRRASPEPSSWPNRIFRSTPGPRRAMRRWIFTRAATIPTPGSLASMQRTTFARGQRACYGVQTRHRKERRQSSRTCSRDHDVRVLSAYSLRLFNRPSSAIISFCLRAVRQALCAPAVQCFVSHYGLLLSSNEVRTIPDAFIYDFGQRVCIRRCARAGGLRRPRHRPVAGPSLAPTSAKVRRRWPATMRPLGSNDLCNEPAAIPVDLQRRVRGIHIKAHRRLLSLWASMRTSALTARIRLQHAEGSATSTLGDAVDKGDVIEQGGKSLSAVQRPGKDDRLRRSPTNQCVLRSINAITVRGNRPLSNMYIRPKGFPGRALRSAPFATERAPRLGAPGAFR